MLKWRKASERGQADHGWLRSQHTFSFASYYDPSQMGFGPLRVINEDRVSGGAGFGRHPHRDMEIISYVVAGGLEHKDSMGTGAVIRPGEIQLMSAGTGVTHSEFNASRTEPVHFLQIWIEPSRRGTTPRYGQRSFAAEDRRDKWLLLAAPAGTGEDFGDIGVSGLANESPLLLGQDARLYTSLVSAGGRQVYEPSKGRKLWLQVIKGALSLQGAAGTAGSLAVAAGDGVAIEDESILQLQGIEEAEILLFDLPA